MSLLLGLDPFTFIVCWIVVGLVSGILVTVVSNLVVRENVLMDVRDFTFIVSLSYFGPLVLLVAFSVLIHWYFEKIIPNRILNRSMIKKLKKRNTLKA